MKKITQIIHSIKYENNPNWYRIYIVKIFLTET